MTRSTTPSPRATAPSGRPVGASIGGTDHENQDRWGATPDGRVAWVLDGVTRADEAAMGLRVAVFVEAADAALGRAAVRLPAAPLRSLLRAALADLATQPEAAHGHRATLALGRRDRRGADWLLLCDACVLGAASTADPVSDPQGLLVQRAGQVALRSDQRLRRSGAINRADGYWIIDGVCTAAADHALVGRIDGPGPVVLMSDGPADGLPRQVRGREPSGGGEPSGRGEPSGGGFWPDPAAMLGDLAGAADPPALRRRLEALRPFLVQRDGRADDLTAVVL